MVGLATPIGTARVLEQSVDICPTLVVGLGGTGKNVLMRVRRLFYERLGRPGDNHIAYRWIDTNTTDRLVDGMENDFILERLFFENSEITGCEVTAKEISHYLENPKKFPHVFDWLEPAAVRAIGTEGMKDGAGQIRPCGRLAFFHNYKKIRADLDSAITELASRKTGAKEVSIQVILVSSLAGGTGSGMFLDVAFLLKSILNKRSYQNKTLNGVLILPSVFAPLHEKRELYANAYGALKELQHYSSVPRVQSVRNAVGQMESLELEGQAREFVARWEGNSTNPEPISGPPFQYCYFVDRGNASKDFNAGDEAQNEVFGLVAESIFLDFEKTRFADRKRAIRINLAQYLRPTYYRVYETRDGKEVVHYDTTYPARFSSFGLSQIYVNKMRIRNAAMYRLSVLLLDQLLDTPKAPASLPSVANEHLKEIGLLPEIVRAKLRLRAEGGSMTERVRQEIAEHLDAALSGIRERRDLTPDLTSVLKSVLTRLKRSGDEAERWGEWVRHAHERLLPDLVTEAKVSIEKKLKSVLEGKTGGLGAVFDYLREYRRLLDEGLRRMEAASTQARPNERRYQQFKDYLREAGELRLFREMATRIEARKAFDAAEGVAIESIDRMTAQLAIVFYKELRGFIGDEVEVEDTGTRSKVVRREGLMLRYWKLFDSLKKIRDEFERRFRSFASAPPSNSRNTFLAADLDYETQLESCLKIPQHETLDKVVLFHLRRLLERVADKQGAGREANISVLLELVQDRAGLEFERLVLGYANECVAEFGNGLDALSMLRSRPDADIVSIIGQAKRASREWVKLSPEGNADQNTVTGSIAFLAIESAVSDDAKEFIHRLDDKEFDPLDHSKDSIVLYHEEAGIPIYFLDGLKEWWEEAYEPTLHGRNNFGPQEIFYRHIEKDFHKYQDIRVVTDAQAALRFNGLKLFLRGVICGLVQYSAENKQYWIQLMGEFEDFVPAPLGRTRHEASEQLSNTATALGALERNIRKRLEEATPSRLRAIVDLTTYYGQTLFPGTTNAHGFIIEYPERRIIIELRREAEDLLKRIEAAQPAPDSATSGKSGEAAIVEIGPEGLRGLAPSLVGGA